MIKLIVFFVLFFFVGCGYPDIEEIPQSDLNVSIDDEINIMKLKKEVNEEK